MNTPSVEFVLDEQEAHRFWSKVKKDPGGCWLWTASCWRSSKTGARQYGYFCLHNGKMIGAHRIAWVLTNGPYEAGKILCHKCDVMQCCNPDHLFLGTQSDNIRDAVKKQRFTIGSRHKLSKLTEAQVLDIRRRFSEDNKLKFSVVAREYKVDDAVISRIVKRKIWKHI